MKTSILCVSLAVNVALAAWLVVHSGPDAGPASNASVAPAAAVEPREAVPPAAVAVAESGPPRAAAPASPQVLAPGIPVGAQTPPSAAPQPAATFPPPSAASSETEASSALVAPPAPEPLESTALAAAPVQRNPFDPAAPGNFLHYSGRRVAVSEAYESGTPGDRSLAVDISPSDGEGGGGASAADSPASPAQNSQTTTATGPPSKTAATGGNDSAGGEVNAFGMTREEVLFRMKWGWAASDAAKTEARREAGK